MELKNRIALVTGSGRGIGRAVAMKLAQEGATVIVNSLTKDSADRTAADIKTQGFKALPYPLDITVRENAFSIVEDIIKRFGTIDIIVSNVGFASHMLVEDMPVEAWDKFINVNLTTPFNLVKAALPHMIEKKYGKIVFIGSIAAARISGLGSADYTAGKCGSKGLAKHLAYEVARYGINVNTVNPGITVTDMMLASTTEEERKTLEGEFPLGLSMPEDMAEAVLFLASDRSKKITGHSIEVEGGALIMYASGYTNNINRRDDISKSRIVEWEKRAQQE